MPLMVRITLLWLCACTPFAVHAEAVDTATAIARASTMNLAAQPHWLRLLHHKQGEKNSEVTSSTFFLAADGRRDSQAELQATIAALLAPLRGSADAHARCRFPARFEWLQAQLDLPSAVEHCPAYEAWAEPATLRSVSLMMVSGFLGNPASSFGHSLLRLNHGEDSAGARLLDLSFNFGARVPEHEPMVAYIARGLMGGYQSGFTSGSYYLQDQVYVRTEFRDVWEYELTLTPAEKLRLAAHLWELSGQSFTYYFLTENCAYRLAELITLATGLPYTPPAQVWFTPVELFHGLVTDQGRTPPLVKQVGFVPSSQRLLYTQFERLNGREAALANQLIADGPSSLDTALAVLTPARKLEVMDTLLAYYEYRLAAVAENAASPDVRANKDAVLRARFALPPRAEALPMPEPLPAPTTGARGMLVGAGVIRDGKNTVAHMRFAPFLQDLIGRHRVGFVELAVLDAEARLHGSHLALDRLDVVRVRKLATAPDIVGEGQWSWQMRAGVRRERLVPRAGSQDDLHAQGGVGLGRAFALGSSALAYASADVVAEGSASLLRGGPSLGLVTRGEGLRARAEVRGEYDLRRERWQPRAEAELGWPLLRDLELRAGLRYDDGDTAMSAALYSTW